MFKFLEFYLFFSPFPFSFLLLAFLKILSNLTKKNRVGGLNVTRSFLFFLAYLLIELIGVLMFLGLWFWQLATSPSQERWIAANYKLQTIWGKYMIFETIRRVLGIKLELEFTPSLTPGPKILFMRHVSFADTLIPQYLSLHNILFTSFQ